MSNRMFHSIRYNPAWPEPPLVREGFCSWCDNMRVLTFRKRRQTMCRVIREEGLS